MAEVHRDIALQTMTGEFTGGYECCTPPTGLGFRLDNATHHIVMNRELSEAQKWFAVFEVIELTDDELFMMATGVLTVLDACIRLIKKEKSLAEGYPVPSPETTSARQRCVRVVGFFEWLACREWHLSHYPQKQLGLEPDVRDLTIPDYFLELERKHEGSEYLASLRKVIFPTYKKSAGKV